MLERSGNAPRSGLGIEVLTGGKEEQQTRGPQGLALGIELAEFSFMYILYVDVGPTRYI
jgi:hypothetical protein